MKRLIPLLFAALLAGLFAWIWVSRETLSTIAGTRPNARTIVPSTIDQESDTGGTAEDAAVFDETRIQPLIPIEQDENFLQALNVDLNKDGIQDQLCAVKKVPGSMIHLIPAMQNPVTGEYTRLSAIQTGITQSRTLLFHIMDILGDRSDALVFSGMGADNMQMLAVYLPVTDKDGRFGYTAIADLRSDGPIVIREVPRYEAYLMGQTTGDSYPIIAYSSDPDAPDTLNQIERTYKWDKTVHRYIQTGETRVTGKKIETTLVRQLQTGDSDSFQHFLDGLWYVPSSAKDSESRFIFFNSPESELVFHNGTTEEIFKIESVVPRRYGIYLTTRNRSISSIRRMIDIELTGIDEIKITVREDVQLKIGVSSDWDGSYRKMSTTASAKTTQSASNGDDLRQLLMGKSAWEGNDRSSFNTEGFAYVLSAASGTETGQFAVLTVKGETVLQMKAQGSEAKTRFLRAQLEKDVLTLTEVAISTNGLSAAGAQPVIYKKK